MSVGVAIGLDVGIGLSARGILLGLTVALSGSLAGAAAGWAFVVVRLRVSAQANRERLVARRFYVVTDPECAATARQLLLADRTSPRGTGGVVQSDVGTRRSAKTRKTS